MATPELAATTQNIQDGEKSARPQAQASADFSGGACGGSSNSGSQQSGQASSSTTGGDGSGHDSLGKHQAEDAGVIVSSSASTTAGSTPTTVVSHGTTGAMDGVRLGTTTETVRSFGQETAARAARQVETALLQDMSQGGRQVTLTLNPEELGNLSVTLTVRDKDVRAVITADSPETAAMLQDQAASIRQTLEEQGFKVTKLDVQTSLAQDNQSSLQGGAANSRPRPGSSARPWSACSPPCAKRSGPTVASPNRTRHPCTFQSP